MGWQDRDYGRTGGQRGALFNILFGSLPLGTWFGIRVRVHSTLVIMIGLNLLFSGLKVRGVMSAQDALISSVILFGIVLLHEFGHCFGARSVGGRADDILLWPFGGLATTDPPRRPWPMFVTTFCGPLVNIIICAACLLILEAVYKFQMPIPLNPLLPFGSGEMIWNDPARTFLRHQDTFVTLSYYVLWIYDVSWMLFVFNVFLPFYPMDGGRMLQEILWPIVGFARSMKIACIIGIVGAVLVGGFGLASGQWMLFMLSIIGVMTCVQTLAMVRAGYFEEEGGPDLSAASWSDAEIHRKIKKSKGWFSKARRRAKQEAAEQAQIDAILAKVHDKGLHSLTWREKRALKRATERQRQRDLAEERL